MCGTRFARPISNSLVPIMPLQVVNLSITMQSFGWCSQICVILYINVFCWFCSLFQPYLEYNIQYVETYAMSNNSILLLLELSTYKYLSRLVEYNQYPLPLSYYPHHPIIETNHYNNCCNRSRYFFVIQA